MRNLLLWLQEMSCRPLSPLKMTRILKFWRDEKQSLETGGWEKVVNLLNIHGICANALRVRNILTICYSGFKIMKTFASSVTA